VIKVLSFLDLAKFTYFCPDSKPIDPMNIERLVFNPFQENTYVLWDETGECIILDAGNNNAQENRRLDAFIAEKGLKPVMAVNTHGHVDHILGVPHVKKTYGVPFALRKEDEFRVEAAPVHGRIYGFNMESAPKVDVYTGDTVRFGNTVLEVIHTPGHTPGHVCLFEPQGKVLFTGDTLFRESIGRTDLPGGDYGWIMRSIIDRILPLGPDVTFYAGHGHESTLGHEMRYNPFITEVLSGDVASEPCG
jgi:glyoxylase-like metal-dependent hydrolase (beta-lactamase superfamily II)